MCNQSAKHGKNDSEWFVHVICVVVVIVNSSVIALLERLDTYRID